MQVVSEAAYRQWMDSFGSQTTHLMANPSAAGGGPILASSARIQARLMALAPQYFSIPSAAPVSPPAAVREASHAAGSRPGEAETAAGVTATGRAAAAAAPASGQGLRPAGPSDINTSNIAGDLANQLAPVPGAVSGVSGQPPANNDIGAALANQIAGVGAVAGQSPSAQGQVAAAQSGGAAGLAVVEIRSTVIQEVNGQQIATAVIIGQGQQAAGAAAA